MSRRPGDRVKRRIVAQGQTKPSLRSRLPDLQTLFDPDATSLSRLTRYLITTLVLVGSTAAMWTLRHDLGLLNIGLIYLILVVGATVFFGRNTGIFASLLGFALFDFFLVPPFLTFVVGDLHNILALFVFLGVSQLLSWLLSNAREQAQEAIRRAEDVSRLYELNRTISVAQRLDQVLPAIAAKVSEVFGAQSCWIFLPDENGRLVVRASASADSRLPTRDEMSLARWAFEHSGEVSQGSAGRDATPKRAAFVPLRVAEHTIGVLGVAGKLDQRPFTRAERTILATFAGQAAGALERMRLLREAQRAEMLARTDELKSALMSAVSHDLRTPLASIIASVTSLLEPDIEWDDETRRDFLQGIYEEATRLNRLVGNLLDMSRIEGGALQPELDWYAIGEVVAAVAGRLEPRLADHQLVVAVADDLPLTRFDFSQIDQVLSNLVENALKYTPTGTVIRVRAWRRGEEIAVSVCDNGPGVTGEQMGHLFERFYRVDGRSRPKGLGLGLAISRGLVEAHGGRIWAERPNEGGLCITFTLPLEQQAATETHTLAAPAAVGA